MKGVYSISIMLSSFNGETFIEEQIRSIMGQKDCFVRLVIRDDGSTDNTVEIIKRLQLEYPNQIEIYCGNNIGYRKSFMELLALAPDSDFYGFADQDDFWKEDKCISGIDAIVSEYGVDSITLYASAVSVCNEQLEVTGLNDIDSPNNIASLFVRHRMGGCTMIFTKGVKRITEAVYGSGINNSFIDHDFMVASVAYSYGNVIRDNVPHILHRRSKKSVTSGGRGIVNRIKMEKFILLKRIDCQYDMAKILVDFSNGRGAFWGELKNTEFLKKVCNYKMSLINTIRLLMDKKLTCGIIPCDIEAKLKILLRNF